MDKKNGLLNFVLKTVGFLAVAAVCWYFIAPFYNRILAAVSSVFINGQAALQGNDSISIFTPEGLLAGGIYALSLHYGLILVIVLIAATPGMKIVRRLRTMAVAVAGIFLLNVISIILFAHSTLSGAVGSGTENPAIVFFAILGSDLFPLIIWGVFSYRYFLPSKTHEPGPAASPQQLHEPVKTGRA